MRNYIEKNKEFSIIPQDVTGATKCVVTSISEDSFEIELKTDEVYSNNESVELFSITPQGLLYFETSAQSVNGKNVKLLFPISHKFLQRREYTRVDLAKNILLKEKDEDKNIRATILDISAGGMKLVSKDEMSLSKDYKVDVQLDKNVRVDCNFQPIRIEYDPLIGYTVSGRFKIVTNVDRISLVQFCFKRQMENQNK